MTKLCRHFERQGDEEAENSVNPHLIIPMFQTHAVDLSMQCMLGVIDQVV